jgi:dihydroxy-acid dehydratase
VRLSVRERRLDLLVDEATLAARRARWTPPPAPARGWDALVRREVLQAPQGADLRFLRPEGA